MKRNSRETQRDCPGCTNRPVHLQKFYLKLLLDIESFCAILDRKTKIVQKYSTEGGQMKQEKVDSILDTAKKMFGRYGIQKTSLHEIARMARVAKATIYNYFGSKNQIYLEVLNREVNDVIEKIEASIKDVASPEDKLRVFMHAKFRYMKDAINILNLSREGIDNLLPKTGSIRDRLFSREVSILHLILEKGVTEGTFYVSNIMLTARAIGYALRGFETTWLLKENDNEIKKHLDNLSDILCSGILVRR
ncbi:MAG: TetR/AcrR family transcriptional regulator [Thermodesulfobacteriota bacterium]|nr:TetR/AcrR family transcriptional regulator [Thermodesulfobacteriota bacterium]